MGLEEIFAPDLFLDFRLLLNGSGETGSTADRGLADAELFGDLWGRFPHVIILTTWVGATRNAVFTGYMPQSPTRSLIMMMLGFWPRNAVGSFVPTDGRPNHHFDLASVVQWCHFGPAAHID